MLLGGAGACLLPTHTHAAEARFRLAIPPKPYADALIDLALQANISLVGAAACGNGGHVTLNGTYSLAEALQQALAGAPCSYRILDARSVRISPAATPQAREPARVTTFVAEVVVTATKRPASLGRVAADISALPREQIEITGAADVGATTGQLAGVLTTNLGPARDKLLIRGLSDGAFTGRTRSTVSTYLDETPINYNAPDPDLRLVDIERVEVVRGPQGALYGSGSISGIYRIVTAKPELDRMTGGVAAQAAQTKGGAPSYEAEGYFNMPLVRDVAALRVVAYHDLQGGYLDNASLQASNVDSTVRDGGRASMRFRLNDNWEFDLLGAGQRLRTNDTHYTNVDPTMAPRSNRVRESHKNDFAYGGAAVRGELGWASLDGSLAFVHHTFSSQFDLSNALASTGPLGGFGADPASIGLYVEKAEASMGLGDVLLRSSGAGRLSWLAGLYGANTMEKSPSLIAIATPGAPGLTTVYDESRRDEVQEVALYGEAAYQFLPAWSASVGGRWFESRVHTSDDIFVLPSAGVSRAIDRGRAYSGFLPKVTVQRDLGEGGLIYGLYSEGYRPGGFNTSGLVMIRQNRQTFAPDRLRNAELGAKLRLLDRRLAVRAVAYYDEWDNIQTDQYRPSGLAYTANVGDAQVMGLETEIGYDWDFGLSVQLNALFSTSKMTSKNPDFGATAAGVPGLVVDELPGVPGASGGVVALYHRPLARGLTLRLSGEASYVGASTVSFDATKATRMGRYFNTRLGAEVAGDFWTAGVFLANVGDEAGDTFAYGNPFSFGIGDRLATPQRPRTLGVRLAAAF